MIALSVVVVVGMSSTGIFAVVVSLHCSWPTRVSYGNPFTRSKYTCSELEAGGMGGPRWRSISTSCLLLLLSSLSLAAAHEHHDEAALDPAKYATPILPSKNGQQQDVVRMSMEYAEMQSACLLAAS